MEINRWKHQEEAVHCFIKEERGILEMATGTGKTRTAIRIMKELFETGQIDQVLIIAYGNDLLEQWYKELILSCQEADLFRWFDKYKEFARFQLTEKRKKIALISREADRVRSALQKMNTRSKKTLVVFDEVHGAGSAVFREAVGDYLDSYRFRLGLSATPVRNFDEEGNLFLRQAIGPVIFQFGLEDAIRKGILCSFEYVPLSYELTVEEKQKKRNIIAAYEKKRKEGILFDEEEMYRELARVNKLAVHKISLFQMYIKEHLDILKQCIIFVETKEYGLQLQKMLLNYIYSFHTYYGNDDRANLERFVKGKVECLITCKKISEGIDIRSVRNIVLFSSDRGRLVTTQRIGRSLRKDPDCNEKRARIIDFIYEGEIREDGEITADQARRDWLEELSKVRENQKNER